MGKSFQLVVFHIGKELYGVGIESVQEIVRVPDVTEVPEAPEFLEGVINLRGRVVPVIDLRKRLRLPGEKKTKLTRVLVTDPKSNAGTGSTIGLLVDSVSEVLKIQPENVEEPPEMISAIGVEYITGVAKVDERLIILINLKKVLSIDDMKRIGRTVSRLTEPHAA